MKECRFRGLSGHVCARRDGRQIPAGDPTPCWCEARAAVADEVALAVQVDAMVPTSWLLANRAAWGGEAA